MMIPFSGYQISNTLYEGTDSLVYRGRRVIDGQPVVLKVLKDTYPTPERIAWFKREYEVTRNLNPGSGTEPALTGIITAYDLKSDNNRWMMILEDFGGESLARLALDGKLALPDFLKFAIDVTDILGQVHQQFIMHKDINPSNILLNPTTGVVKLIDFGISTVLSREDPTFRNPNVLEGTLPYISPEQTGRMNRTMDYRTDFYSLGVTFYQLLTGQLPFAADDALELVHCHIAKHPIPPHECKPAIPLSISALVMKLMAKNAENRYQSAYGLKIDLETCLQQWQQQGQIASFPLGRHDVAVRFQLPQKLYGREQAIEALLTAFEQVSTPQSPAVRTGSAMMLVSGYAGIGKTALVQEVYKPITYRRGYFIGGKFDQLQRDIPYTAFIQAFRLLIQQLLTEREAEIAVWREKLWAALSPNGQVIRDVIPEVELIIGPQPEVPTLSPKEAQNRFNLLLQNFIRVFATAEHPLVIFLDDLQWADAASLKLLELLLTSSNEGYLFLIGAYRDNEVGEMHPLKLTLLALEQAGAPVNHIALAPLALPHLTQLISDTFDCSSAQAEPLAELVLTKTNGNPFFISEFLKALYTERLLSFVPPAVFPAARAANPSGWQWDLAQIQKRDMTDNVIKLLADKVQQLPVATQQILELAACIGNQFDLLTLATVYQKSLRETATDLWNAIVEGLILPLNDTYKLVDLEVEGLATKVAVAYKFTHDRIQQAVYSLISAENKQIVHYRIGRLLVQNITLADREERLFDIVNQLNAGRVLIQAQLDWEQLAQLNLLAARKAKASAAYQSAFTHLQIGLELLTTADLAGGDSWSRQYELSLQLYEEAAEIAYLTGKLAEMSAFTATIFQRARTLLDKVKAYEVIIAAYTGQNKLIEAIETARQVLALLGVPFSEQPGPADIMAALHETQAALAGRNPESLLDLPLMTDADKLATIRILDSIFVTTFVALPALTPLLVSKQVNLSIEFGNTAESISAYANYGVILCSAFENYDMGYHFGQLALRLADRLNAKKFKAKIYLMLGGYVSHWKEHIAATLPSLLDGYQIGLETGDFGFGCNCLVGHAVSSYLTGKELAAVEQEMANSAQVINQLGQATYLHWHHIYWQAVLNWQGKNEDMNPRLRGKVYNEDKMMPVHLQANDQSSVFNAYFNKMILCYHFQEFQQAAAYAGKAAAGNQPGSLFAPIFHLYHSLAQLALFPESTAGEQAEICNQVEANQVKMKLWAQHATMNYLHKFYLVEAERSRVLGHDSQARDYYDQAIDLAIENEYLNEEALAYELAGRFYLARGQTRIARQYLHGAHYAYQRWGAVAKVKDIEQRYPHLLQRSTSSAPRIGLTTTTTSTDQSAAMLDLTSVLKASQAISGEIQLDKLLDKLMKIVIENAGAQCGFLLLERKGQWWIEAEGMIEPKSTIAPGTPEVTTQQASAVTTSDRLATTIINYVARTKEAVVLDDATQSSRFTQDPYIRHSQPKSVLCTPLLNQGKLTAILYLENNLATNVFTQERLEVLKLLSAQAAISLENARLYTHQVALTHGYSRFVPQEILHFLQKESIVDVKLGDQVQQEMAILVSDVRSFTTLSETMTPQENFDFVNAYLGRVSPIVRQHGGLIVKYMGDGMMAVFPTRAEDALRAALDKLRAVERYNDVRRTRGYVPLQIGIGIHTGTMMLGTVGEPERMQSDLLSDAVNLTARLEGLAKEYGAALIISQEFLQRLPDPTVYQMRFLGKAQVKGRQALVTIYEIFDADPPAQVAGKAQTKADFEAALTLFFDQRFAEAYALFQRVLQHNSQDKAAALYVQRTILALQPPPPLNPAEIASRSEE